MPSNIDAECARMIAKSPGEVRTWCAQARQQGIRTVDSYERTALEFYQAGAGNVWVGEVEECEELVWMIHCLIIELPADPAAAEQVKARYEEVARKSGTDAPERFIGEQYIQLWCAV